jgi:tetratricopeptide (TPR) repeat protein
VTTVFFAKSCYFHTWEGSGEVHDVYIDAYLLRGRKSFADKEYDKALEDYLAAGEYPENLEVGRPENDGHAPWVNYFVATAYEALGNKVQARRFYQKAAQRDSTEYWPQTQYYQALAFGKLGQSEKAKQIFDQLISTGQEKLTEDMGMDFFAKFGEQQSREVRMASAHYITGLGYAGNGQMQKAKSEFEQAIKLNVNHLWAAVELAQLE